MKAIDVLGLGLYGLRARRLRSALSALGIAIGIAAMVSVAGISESSRAGVLSQLDRLGTNLLTVSPGRTFMGDQAELPAEATGMIGRLNGVQSVTSTAALSAHVYRNDHIPTGETGGLSVLAVRPDLLEQLGASAADGVFLNAATSRYPAVVLGSFAAQHLGVDQPGVAVWLGGRWFAVVGILNPVTLAPELDSAALVGWDVALDLLGFDGHPATEYVRTDPDRVQQVQSLLAATANPAHPEQVQVSRPSDALAARAVANNAFTTLLLGLGSVALLVGAIGVANVMIIAVLERRPEVGLRRALGASRSLIGAQFLIEAVFLSLAGGAAGCLLGTLATVVYALSQGWLLDVPPAALTAGLAGAVLIGAISGVYPALRAARLAPTEALRTV
ncbi:MAG TPA: ABC transporter permease [Candidatus Dormibacteraeota bacterium]